MTMAETYIAHTVNKLKNINTIGLRNISHNVNHEGRGGWTCSAYFEKYTDDGWGISPFLFPEGFDGKEYITAIKNFMNICSIQIQITVI